MSPVFSHSKLRYVLVILVCVLAASLAAALVHPADRIVAPPPSLHVDGAVPMQRALWDRVCRYTNARQVTLQDFSPDCKSLLVLTRFGNTEQLHRIDSPLGNRVQLTFQSEPVDAGVWCPESECRHFIFAMDSGGDENYQLYRHDLKTRLDVRLTDGRSRHVFPSFSRTGKLLAFSGNARNGKDMDLYVVDPERPAAHRLVAAVTGSWTVADWTENDRALIAQEFRSARDSVLWLVGLSDGKQTRVAPRDPREHAYYGHPHYLPGRNALLAVTDRDSEFRRLAIVGLADGRHTYVGRPPVWDVEEEDVDSDGRRAVYSRNEDGTSRLYLLDLATGKDVAVPGLPPGHISELRFCPDGRRVGFTLATARSAGDVWLYEIGGGKLVRWSESEMGPLDLARLPEPIAFRYPTFDRVNAQPRTVPAYYYPPPPGRTRSPVVILAHGGPEGQWRPTFNPWVTLLNVELGCAVILPNVRGSAGYGKAYLDLDNGRHREDAVKDIGALLDWIAGRPELDAARIAIDGVSYGGYLAMASLYHYPGRLKAGLEEVGLANIVTFLKNTKAYRQDLRRLEYGDEREPSMAAYLESISPLRNAALIRSPLLALQGANDPRVPPAEASQMVKAVRSMGTPVWYAIASDEGHGFERKENRDFATCLKAAFLVKYLLRR